MPDMYEQRPSIRRQPMSPADIPCVTQAMLARIDELRRLDRELSQLRNSVVEMLTNGAAVEPGPLSPELRETVARSFSFEKLVKVIGKQQAEDLKRRIEPTIQQRLHIHGGESED